MVFISYVNDHRSHHNFEGFHAVSAAVHAAATNHSRFVAATKLGDASGILTF